ncbi:hypothetical protein [Cyanobium sp. NIES-981]|uniref:hypothetical protein n=1 Tax=Cyanobium sp. NIES-981 TaxID=1851505 RepID=UPI0007DDF7B9|nr:hypothetical protein [Cyanobium sp. NIES-981]SBO42605.1 conserved exported protein of unknown function [Cyanobium sp. NIES-981]
MTTQPLPTRLLALLGATGLCGLVAAPSAALARPRAWQQPTYVLVPARPVPASRVVRSVDRRDWRSQRVYDTYPVQTTPYRRESRVDELRADLEREARRCNTGRLVGGLLGGGAGYIASQDEGRDWAVPLGALLGSQVGCNVGAGRGPAPW